MRVSQGYGNGRHSFCLSIAIMLINVKTDCKDNSSSLHLLYPNLIKYCKMRSVSFCITITIAILSINVYGQQTLTLAGKRFRFPKLKQDTVTTFNNRLVQDGILPSIKNSTYPFEIRYTFQGAFGMLAGEGHCIIIRGTKDSLFALDYILSQDFGRAKVSDTVIHKYDNRAWHIVLHKRRLTPKVTIDGLVQTLIDHNIAQIPDDQLTVEHLRNEHVPLNPVERTDCCVSIVYEVKVNNQFRNFRTNYFYQENNQNIKALQDESSLDNVFHQLAPNFVRKQDWSK
jgi:hypothetical protein